MYLKVTIAFKKFFMVLLKNPKVSFNFFILNAFLYKNICLNLFYYIISELEIKTGEVL